MAGESNEFQTTPSIRIQYTHLNFIYLDVVFKFDVDMYILMPEKVWWNYLLN